MNATQTRIRNLIAAHTARSSTTRERDRWVTAANYRHTRYMHRLNTPELFPGRAVEPSMAGLMVAGLQVFRTTNGLIDADYDSAGKNRLYFIVTYSHDGDVIHLGVYDLVAGTWCINVDTYDGELDYVNQIRDEVIVGCTESVNELHSDIVLMPESALFEVMALGSYAHYVERKLDYDSDYH